MCLSDILKLKALHLFLFLLGCLTCLAFANDVDKTGCITLSTEIRYVQHEAPEDISDVIKVITRKINDEIDHITSVRVHYSGDDIHRFEKIRSTLKSSYFPGSIVFVWLIGWLGTMK